MNTTALVFLLAVWIFVLGLTVWCFYRLMRSDPSNEPLPPPGSIP
jgi:heme/copper-type cytochrome/quinol oxidase subunit 2